MRKVLEGLLLSLGVALTATYIHADDPPWILGLVAVAFLYASVFVRGKGSDDD